MRMGRWGAERMKRRQFAKRLFAFFGVLCVMYLHYRALKEMESSFGFDRPDGESTEEAETKADGTVSYTHLRAHET